MPRRARELTKLEVDRLRAPGLHAVGGVPGLYLQVVSKESRSWIYRASIHGRRRDMGLGSFRDVSLAEAREEARRARRKIMGDLETPGVDPIEARKAAKAAAALGKVEALTFKKCAERYIAAHESGWKSPRQSGQWTSSLESYAYPVIGALPVGAIDTALVMKVLEGDVFDKDGRVEGSLWTARPETASRVRGRLESVLDWARVRGERQGENPARWRGHLDKLLPARGKVAPRGHHAALPFADIGAFMERLRAMEGQGARALEFAILTAARSGEVRGATWSEIDLEARIWTIPAARMKATREHRVPLSDAALAILAGLPRMAGSDLVFVAPRGGDLSDMTLSAVCRRMKVEAVPHGFRSTFRDWVAERTAYPGEMAEMALAHAIGNKVEAAYRRGDLFDRRRRMMEEWAAYCATIERPDAKVTPMRARA
ncbi:MAG: integrase arm-type DNA-binding domain-containing protein [Caulobacteraceae bacterium]